MQETIERLRDEGRGMIAAAAAEAELEAARVSLLGRKGRLTQLLRGLGQAPPERRPALGAELNRLKQELEAAIEARGRELAAAGAGDRGPALDLTLPGRPPIRPGALHPLRTVIEEICDIFHGLGFEVLEGPDVELDYYNFTALNFPDEHPARDLQDTFYLDDRLLLRTQTSPVQVRTMERRRPPLACVVPGRVYRNETTDASHAAEFYQIEGLRVDEDVSLADLHDTVGRFVGLFFGGERAIRFRPHYFPFTEPSVEVDMGCVACGGSGCGVCGGSGWLEIMGAGMVHPHVFAAAGYEADAYTGFAFGMGIDRIAMQRHGIDDIRLFHENDLRFLGQFRSLP